MVLITQVLPIWTELSVAAQGWQELAVPLVFGLRWRSVSANFLNFLIQQAITYLILRRRTPSLGSRTRMITASCLRFFWCSAFAFKCLLTRDASVPGLVGLFPVPSA
jgi:hypothetical protein